MSYVGFLLGAINTLLLFPRITDPEEFGLMRVLLSIAFILAQFSEFGSSNMQSRYLTYIVERHGDAKSMYVWVFRKIIYVFLLLVAIVYFFRDEIIDQFKDRSELIESFFFMVIPLAGALLIFNVLEAYARARLRIVFPTFLRDIYTRLFTLVSLVALYYNLVDFNGFVWLFLLAYISAFVILGIYVLYLDKGVVVPGKAYVEQAMFKEMFFYGLITIFGTTVWRLVNELDSLIIGILDDLEGVAIYATAFYFVTVIQLPQRYLHQITIPILANALNRNDKVEINNLYKKVSLNEFLIGVFLFLMLWFNLDLIYGFMPAIYKEGAGVVFTIGVLRLFDMSTGLNGDMIIYSKYYRYTMLTGGLLLVLSILTNYWLIPIYGILGAAIATALSVFVFNSINLALVYWKYGIHPFSLNMLPALVAGVAILLLLGWLQVPENIFLQSVLRSVVIIVVYPAVLLGFKLSPEINQLTMNSLVIAKNWLGVNPKKDI